MSHAAASNVSRDVLVQIIGTKHMIETFLHDRGLRDNDDASSGRTLAWPKTDTSEQDP